MFSKELDELDRIEDDWYTDCLRSWFQARKKAKTSRSNWSELSQDEQDTYIRREFQI